MPTKEQVLELVGQYREIYGDQAHKVALLDIEEGSLTWLEVEELLR